MYKDIARSNKNYNSTILKLYHKLRPEKQKKIIQCFQEALEKRIKENNIFTQKTNKSNDIGHLSYPELIENVLKQLQFGPDTLTSPLPSLRRLQSAPPLRQLNRSNISNTKISRRLTYPDKEITYSDKENAGNKFKKTKRRKKEKKKREQRKRENKREIK